MASSRLPASARALLALAALLAVSGCYGHHGSHRPRAVPVVRPPLPGPTSGVYVLTEDGREVGRETFTITSSAGVWRLSGHREVRGVVPSVLDYTLEFEERSAEPLGFQVKLEILGEERTVWGRRSMGYLHVQSSGVGGKLSRAVPYAAGTGLDGPSPVLLAPTLALLGPVLAQGEPIAVRTVVLVPPRFDPEVQLETFTSRDEAGPVRRIELELGGGGGRVGLWVRSDGLVVKARMPRGAHWQELELVDPSLAQR